MLPPTATTGMAQIARQISTSREQRIFYPTFQALHFLNPSSGLAFPYSKIRLQQ